MSPHSLIFAIVIPMFSSQVFAGNFTTHWNIKNEAKSSIQIFCNAFAQGGAILMKMETSIIPPLGSYIYDWGQGWDNDGLGLNPGQWTCNAGNKVDIGEFKSDWGEEISLLIRDEENGIKITKVGSEENLRTALKIPVEKKSN